MTRKEKTKDTVIFKGFYLGENKPHARKGHRIWLEFNKKDLLLGYQRQCTIIELQDLPKMSLLVYVREMVNEVYLTGELQDIVI
jgi:hypothetical protein